MKRENINKALDLDVKLTTFEKIRDILANGDKILLTIEDMDSQDRQMTRNKLLLDAVKDVTTKRINEINKEIETL